MRFEGDPHILNVTADHMWVTHSDDCPRDEYGYLDCGVAWGEELCSVDEIFQKDSLVPGRYWIVFWTKTQPWQPIETGVGLMYPEESHREGGVR